MLPYIAAPWILWVMDLEKARWFGEEVKPLRRVRSSDNHPTTIFFTGVSAKTNNESHVMC